MVLLQVRGNPWGSSVSLGFLRVCWRSEGILGLLLSTVQVARVGVRMSPRGLRGSFGSMGRLFPVSPCHCSPNRVTSGSARQREIPRDPLSHRTPSMVRKVLGARDPPRRTDPQVTVALTETVYPDRFTSVKRYGSGFRRELSPKSPLRLGCTTLRVRRHGRI